MINKLIGHKDIFFKLKYLYDAKKFPNNILLSGPDGIGKNLISKHLLNYILSKDEDLPYDIKNLQINNQNRSNKLLENNTHTNIFRIYKKDDKKNIDISQVREMIKFQNTSSFNNKERFVLIEDANLLNQNSVNALLKSVEEPNNNLNYIITHNSNFKLIETLKSRCIEFKINLESKYTKTIVDEYFNESKYDLISDDFINHYNNPSFLIKFIEFNENEGLEITNITIEKFLFEIFNNSNFLKDDFILSNLNLFIELYFYKNINVHRKNLFKTKEYFFKKLSNVRKYNLDLETFFLEFKEIISYE